MGRDRSSRRAVVGRFAHRCALLVTFLGAGAPAAGAQAPLAPEATVSVFFDCQTVGCRDLDFFRRAIPFVNWVRDRESAHVHVLVTSRTSGGGGRSYEIDFIGVGERAGLDRSVTAETPGDATEDDRREAVAARVRAVLVGYVADLPVARRLRVELPGAGAATEGRDGAAPGAPEDDPWDSWVFQVGLNGFVNGQSSTRFSNRFTSFSANRTTEAWKLTTSLFTSKNVQRFELEDTVVEARRSQWSAEALLVGSVGDRWAVGLRADLGAASRLNQDVRVALRAGVEHDFFPYSESSRRSLTVQYLVGPWHFDYEEPTLFGEVAETRWQESLTADLSLVQPWGRWSTAVTGSHYLHDTSKYNVRVSGNLDVRLFRGFSVRLSGNYSWIRDQLFLPAEGATDEEILLQQRQLATSYQFFTSFGITYRFGSIFNNVVNPRFGSSGGEIFF